MIAENPQNAKKNVWQQTNSDYAITNEEFLLFYDSSGIEWNWVPLAIINNSTAPGTVTTTRNLLYFWPYIVPFDVIIDKISINVTTLRASTTGRMGLYKNNHTVEGIGYPDDLIFQTSTTFDMTTTGVKTQSDMKLRLTGGEIYWVAFTCGGSTTNPVVRSVAQASLYPIGIPSTLGANMVNGFSIAYTYAALPYNVPSGTPTNNTGALPMIAVRYDKRI